MTPAYTTRSAVLLLGLVSALALAVALVLQEAFGYPPCELCLVQRWWHLAVVTAAALTLVAARPRLFLTIQTAALLICFGYSLFHVGVERHWWGGLAACTGPTGATTVEALRDQILATPVVRCDDIRWRLFGLSMATYDAMLTFCMAAFALFTSVRKNDQTPRR